MTPGPKLLTCALLDDGILRFDLAGGEDPKFGEALLHSEQSGGKDALGMATCFSKPSVLSSGEGTREPFTGDGGELVHNFLLGYNAGFELDSPLAAPGIGSDLGSDSKPFCILGG